MTFRKGEATRWAHGYAGTTTYKSWTGMRNRCRNPDAPKFKHYGGRGITICERWEQFQNFLADMGERPAGLSLGRMDNDGNYEPSNCRWETPMEQGGNTRRNRLFTCNGVTMTLSDWSRHTGLNITTIFMRVFQYGWTLEQALTKPVQSTRKDKLSKQVGRSAKCSAK